MVRTGDWIKEGWALVQKDLGMQIVAALVVGAGSSITGGILGPALMCGWIWVLLQRRRNPGYALQLGDIFSKGFEVFVPALVAGILISVFASVGSIACGVGAIVVGAMTVLAMPLIVDKKMEFWPAIQLSFETTKKEWLGWSLFMLVLGLINVAGAIVCVLPILVTYPLTVAAIVVAYDETFKGQA